MRTCGNVECGKSRAANVKMWDVECGKLRAVDVEIPEVHYHVDDILLLHFSPS